MPGILPKVVILWAIQFEDEPDVFRSSFLIVSHSVGLGEKSMEIRRFEPADQGTVVELWQRCGLVAPGNDPVMDIQRKLTHDADLLLVGLVEEDIVASVMVGYEGHRGWINYLAVDPDRRGQGLGRRMMESAEERLANLGCPKINLQVRGDNNAVVDFYRSLGYQVEDRISLGKRLGQVEPGSE